jgi:hypothetical protein
MVRTFVAVVATISVIILVAMTYRNLPPATHVAAVTQVLAQQDAIPPIHSIEIQQLWPSALPFYAYGDDVMPYQARIRVQLLTGGYHAGVLTCRAAPHDCVMTIPGLAVFGVAIPDVQPVPKWYTGLRSWFDAVFSPIFS